MRLVFYALSFVAYALPFVIVLAMPGWRSLVVTAIALAALVGWQLLEIQKGFDAGDDSIGGIFALGWLQLSAIGTLGGLVTRSITIALRGGKWRRAIAPLSLFGFLAGPAIILGSIQWSKWQERLPEEACLALPVRIELKDKTYDVPLVPFVSFVTGRGKSPETLRPGFNPRIREICARNGKERRPIQVNAVIFRFEDAKRGDSVSKSLCTPSRTNRLAATCGKAGVPDPDMPLEFALYAPDTYEHGPLLATGSSSYEGFLAEKAAAEAAGKPLTVEQIGAISVYSNGFRIDRSDPGNPVALHCWESKPGDTSFCQTTRAFGDGLMATYEFRAPLDQADATDDAMEQRLKALMAEFEVKP